MKRFRWTRRKYRHAQHLARLLNRWNVMPDSMPDIVRRYFDLWEEYRETGDPLMTPLRFRYDREDIPF